MPIGPAVKQILNHPAFRDLVIVITIEIINIFIGPKNRKKKGKLKWS